MYITKNDAVNIISKSNDIYLLTHRSPDGDTLGSAFGLCRVLVSMGKRVKVLCSDNIPDKYDYMSDGLPEYDFEPQTVIAVDVGDVKLLGDRLSVYAERIDLCIDHHQSHKPYAKATLLDSTAAATAEIMYDLVCELTDKLDIKTAECLYTGIATDTGCFRFSNTTAKTHRIAADLIALGIDHASINIKMFEEKTRSRVELERIALNSFEFFCGGNIALIVFDNETLMKLNADDGDLEGIQSLPIQVKGVSVGITVKEKVKGSFRVSLRTREPIDAAEICSMFGGGGHARAAGCQLTGDLDECRQALLEAVSSKLNLPL